MVGIKNNVKGDRNGYGLCLRTQRNKTAIIVLAL